MAAPLGRSFASYRGGYIPADLIAGLTLAAIAIPEQMATARLAGMPPQAGFFAFIAAAIGFALFGAGRTMSVGADSTIAPIFAGSLAALAAAGSAHYGADAAVLALMVGVLVAAAGVFRLGFIGDLLSAPVMTGFLAGIAVHILAAEAPAALGLPAPHGEIIVGLVAITAALGRANPWDLALAAGVVAAIVIGERLSRKAPSALLALGAATLAWSLGRLGDHGVAVLGAVPGGLPAFTVPNVSLPDLARLAPLAVLVALVVMVQTAAVDRAFAGGDGPDGDPDVDRDFIGVGAANLLAGLAGAFAVNASPPRSAIVKESGGRSQLASLAAAAIIAGLLFAGMGLLRQIPEAALAGILIFVASRLLRVGEMIDIARRSPAELSLVAATAAAVALLPTEWGVAIGVLLSILHGVWSTARTQVQRFHHLPGGTVWWPQPRGAAQRGEDALGVIVLGFPAALTFLNASNFAREFLKQAAPGSGVTRLAVLEAAGITMIDFTAARSLAKVVRLCRAGGVEFALARLESPAAQAALERLGLHDSIGADHIFSSVAQAIDAFGPKARST